MNTPSNPTPESLVDSRVARTSTLSLTRPMYWSVRRELWENRSIYWAPLVVANVALIGFLVNAIHLPEERRALLLLAPAAQREAIDKPYDVVAMLLIANTFLVGVLYCLDALHGERRDRSILFWKSLPVSDRTTVLSKACIALMVLPLLAFAIMVATQLLMRLVSGAILLGNGMDVLTGPQQSAFEQAVVQLYGIATLALWHAPIYAWLLLVSSWARRATFLFAVLPPLAVCILEKIAWRSSHFFLVLKYRFVGHLDSAFAFGLQSRIDPLANLTPGTFLSTPGLWTGLCFAAVCLAAATRLRRRSIPI